MVPVNIIHYPEYFNNRFDCYVHISLSFFWYVYVTPTFKTLFVVVVFLYKLNMPPLRRTTMYAIALYKSATNKKIYQFLLTVYGVYKSILQKKCLLDSVGVWVENVCQRQKIKKT